MRRVALFFFPLFLLLFFAGNVLAVPPAVESTPPGLIKRVEVQQRVQERRATLQAQLTERRRELIRAFFNRMVRRIEAAIARLETLIERIESRIAKLEAAGEDMTDVKEQVEDAKDKLAAAEDDLQDAKDGLEDVLTSDDPKEAFAEVRDLIRGVVRQLIEVHRILVQVIGDIKGLRVGQLEASPTPTATAIPTPSPSPSPSPTATPTPTATP